MQMWNMKKLCIKWSQMYNNDVFIYTSLRSFRSVSQAAVSRYFWHTQFPQKTVDSSLQCANSKLTGRLVLLNATSLHYLSIAEFIGTNYILQTSVRVPIFCLQFCTGDTVNLHFYRVRGNIHQWGDLCHCLWSKGHPTMQIQVALILAGMWSSWVVIHSWHHCLHGVTPISQEQLVRSQDWKLAH